MHNPLPYLPFKIYHTPIKINNNFISKDVSDATYIILLVGRKADITLLKLGKIIKNDELNFPFEVSIQIIFEPAEFFRGILGGVNGKFFSVQVK